ncbi:MAG: aminopeptidase N [Acidimicrobiia bacterium]|nr:aminopeptidase N [Acidimicrobiia bacterium]
MDVALEIDRLTQTEARARAAVISGPTYQLDLDLEAGAKTYAGDCTIRFGFVGEEPTFLDFTGSVIEKFTVNGIDREPIWHENRVQLPAEWLAEDNEVRVRYVNNYDHTGEGFHQFFDPEDGAEYLYTQFEPFSAHRMFPCFDQPDLKATYELAITAPDEWVVLAASRIVVEDAAADGRVRRAYEPTVPFSTYLLSVVAGPYRHVASRHNGLPLGLFCRASLIDHLDSEELFAVTAAGIDFFAEFFGHPYPFSKYDQIFVPEFNWGGMENVGNVTYSERMVFRDPPTLTQRMGRAEVFLHELAHQWFGDLVTMEWWNDVWLNESFATYMAYLGLERVTDFADGWQDFQADMKLWAMEADQLPTTHRVADAIPSTDETYLNFDGITYGKGAAALKQLVAAVGEDVFREGMQTYFSRFAFGTATLSDFLTAVSDGSGTDVHAWSAAWLETPSLNTLSVEWAERDGRVTDMRLVQEASGENRARPHVVDVAVVRQESGALELDSHRVEITGDSEPIALPVGQAAPVLVFPNHGDHTYAKITLDSTSLAFAKHRLDEVADPLLRQQLWAALWDMVRDQRLSSLDYLRLVEDKLVAESNLHIVKLVTGIATSAIARYVPESERPAETSRFFAAGRRALELAPAGDPRALWLRAMLLVVETPADLTAAAGIIDGDHPVPGLSIDQEMRWALAVRGSAAGLEGAEGRAAAELERDPSDRGRRAMLSVETAVPDAASKEQAWGRIHGDGYGSLHLDRAAMAGFNWASQAVLLEPFVERFFGSLERVFGTREHEAAKAYFATLYPRYRVDEVALGHARSVLASVDGPPQLERLLIETIDRQERALASREFAAR